MEGQNPAIVSMLDNVSTYRFEMTRAEAHDNNICIICKEPALSKCYSDAGLREYGISGICETCFDKLFDED